MQKIIHNILLIIVFTTYSAAQTLTIEVCATCNETSIKAAVEKANPGDTVLVKKGLYKETGIIIDKPLKIGRAHV